MSCTSLSSHAITSHIKFKALFSPAPPGQSGTGGKLVTAALPCSLFQHPLHQPHLGQRQQGLMNSYIHCHLHQWQIIQHVEQCNRCQHLRFSSFIFPPGNFRMTKIYGTSNVNRNSFHYHAEKVLSSASATQI